MTKRLIIIIAAFLPVLPLLIDGYILSYDMAWGPNYPTNTNTNTALLTLFLHTLGNIHILGAMQIVILLVVISVSITGYIRLVESQTQNIEPWVCTAVGILSVYNPFFYTRLITGQWLVLIGYALLPWALIYFLRLIKTPTMKSASLFTIIMILITFTSIHTIFIVGIACLVIAAMYRVYKSLRTIALIVGSFSTVVLANIFWIIPILLSEGQLYDQIQAFTSTEMTSFQTNATVGGSAPLSSALLLGFWADNTNRYILPNSLPIFWIGAAIIFSATFIGILLSIKRRSQLGITLLVLGIIAWLLSIGIAWGPTALITNVLNNLIPIYKGYREPQKWLMLLVLIYVYFFATGADRLFKFVKNTNNSIILRYTLITILIIAPFLYTPTLAWGAAGQLKSVNYPEEWYEAKTYLNSQTSKDARVLVFPWHMYLPISWVGRVVANPSSYFFDQTMVISNDPEIRGVAPEASDKTRVYVNDYVIPNVTVITGLGKRLHQYNIQYIMLEKEADYARYEPFLKKQTDIKNVYENDKIAIYKVSS